ncbi:hypothetical protein QFC19_004074 [Naganishia cerealis]|uniref:Uncharacterized protein n=1 Tax=Naganishia cerealis TaxID=610337 RepID=A0ACC2VY32_9TREE|nr:hypothetical protein QFC19_004074 [Naganishia cerealis]
MIYMANCGGSCGGIPGGDLDWFKIGQEGYHDGKWPNDRLLPSNKWAQHFTLPTNLPSGNYLVANHMLALHNVGEPQFYPVAYQINLKSSGTVDPQPKGRFPDIYLSGPQDFRTWNIYEEGPNNAAMKLPGIAVYKGSDAKIGDTGFNGAQDGVGAVAGKKQSDAPKKVTAVKAVVSSSTKKSATKSTSNPSSKATTNGKGGHGSPQVGALAKTGRPSDATGKEKGPSASIPKGTTANSDKGQSMVTVTVTVYGSAPTAGAVDSQRSPEDEKTQGELKPSEEDDGSESASGQRALFLQTEDERPSDEDDECESASGQRAPFLQAEHEEEGSDVDDECEDVSEQQVSLMKNEATGQRYRGRRSRMVPRHQRHHYKGSQAPSSPVSS